MKAEEERKGRIKDTLEEETRGGFLIYLFFEPEEGTEVVNRLEILVNRSHGGKREEKKKVGERQRENPNARVIGIVNAGAIR